MAPSRGLLHSLLDQRCARVYCPVYRCSRPFASTAVRGSGHNRWSKIKHDKGKNDAAKNRQRSVFAQELAMASKMFGPEPSLNPRLADLISKAKREGYPKASIEAAIARGQGRSLNGASLESVTVEGILPNNIGVIIECETDNRLRTLQEVRLVMKNKGGNASPSSYLFQKKGRITFEPKDGISIEEVLEPALEAGASDVEEGDEGRMLVFTEPGETQSVGEEIAKALDLQIATSEILWEPNKDTQVDLSTDESAQALSSFVDELQDKESSVQAVAMNVAQGTLDEEAWKELQSRLTT